MQSEHILVSNLQENYDRIEDILDDYLFRLDIKGKNANRFSLLTEEAVRLVKSIANDKNPVEIWFDGNARVSHICLMLETIINPDKQAEYISIATSGENSADRTFFDNLREIFIKPKAATWSLSEYEAQIMEKRQEDKFSEDAWENLERSVLANLADDISVGVKDNHVLMIITKDFSESLVGVGTKKPSKISKQIFLAADANQEEAQHKVDSLADELELKPKDSLRIKLLLEETIGMISEMAGDFTALLWVEKYKSHCAVKLIGNTQMDVDKKLDILDLSKNKQNALAHGFMGKVKDIIETSILSYKSVMKLQQEYNGVAINYAGLGIYNGIDVATNPAAFSGVMWSMADYRAALDKEKNQNEGAKAAWDELEKSIVASIADDVIVGVKGSKVKITIIYKLKED